MGNEWLIMANYSMLFGGVQQQPTNLVGSFIQGQQAQQRSALTDAQIATQGLQQQGLKLQNQSAQDALDMSAAQRLTHIADGLAGMADDAQRNRVYQAVLPHLRRLDNSHQWPATISQQDAKEFSDTMRMLQSGQMTPQEIQAKQLELAKGNLDARNREIDAQGKRADRQLNNSDQQLALEREKISYAKDQDRRQRDALAKLAAPVDGTNGAVPPPNYADLPASTLTKMAEQNSDPKVIEERRNAAITKAGEITKGANTFDLIDSIITDPALESSTGGFGVVYRNLPGTEGKRVDANIKRLQGNTFLQSVQQIKGMGALSNTEGDKVQAAAAALDPQMNSKDFRKELIKFRNTVVEGIRNTWVADNPKIPAEDIDTLIQRPDLAEAFKKQYGSLPKGFERVKGYLSGPSLPESQPAAAQTGAVKFLGFE